MKNLKWKALCIVMCLCFAVFTAYAQKNINAYNYGNEEVFPIADGLASDDEGVYVNAAQLPNGKVVSVGYLSNDVLVSVFDPQTQTATRITLPEVISSGEAHSVIPLADNSYMIFGLGGNEVTKGLAAKIDSAGNVEVLAAPASQELKRVNYVYGDVLNDGSVIVAGIGTFTNDKKQPVVVKFNTDGTSQLLNLPELVMDGGHFSDVCALADGSFIAVGQRDSNSIPLIVKFSADGQGKVIPTPAEITNGEFMKLTKDANGNVVAVGEGRINEEAQQIAVKIKPDESVSVFEKPSNVTNYERVYFYHVMAQDDGSFLASGTAEINGVETGVVVRLSDEGSLLLNPQMDLSNGLFYATKALPDGTVVSVGTAYNSISGLSEPCVIQFDTNGNGKRIAMSAEIGMLVDVIALADGSFMVFGMSGNTQTWEIIPAVSRFTLIAHTVNFQTFDGSQVASQTLYDEGFVTIPNEPTKEGYIFEGWYTDEQCTIAYDFNSPVKSSFTLYAKWEEKLEIPSNPGNENPKDGNTTNKTPNKASEIQASVKAGDSTNKNVFFIAAVGSLMSIILLRARKRLNK